jgi:hypothetical protein
VSWRPLSFTAARALYVLLPLSSEQPSPLGESTITVPVCSNVENAAATFQSTPRAIIRVFPQERENCNDVEKHSEKKPQPRIPAGILCPKSTKGSEQEKDSAVRPMSLDRSWEVYDAPLQLRNAPVRLLVRQDGLGDEVWQQEQ